MARAQYKLEVATGMENPMYRKLVYTYATKEAEACGCSPDLWPDKVFFGVVFE